MFVQHGRGLRSFGRPGHLLTLAPHASGDLRESLSRLGLIGAAETVRVTPLAGGVSSDISLVEAGGRRFCVKRALPRLKVAALWEAPVGRNAAEAAWMRAVRRWLPRAAPEVLGEDRTAGLFAMEYLPPADFALWKTELLAGQVDTSFAVSVGRDLGLIHARSTADPSLRVAFANDETFEAIRTRALSARDCPRASLACPPLRRARDHDACDQALARARRREPEEHSHRSAWPGLSRRRMRVVRRSRLRPRLLPQPPPPERRARRRRQGATSSPLSPRWPAPISNASTGRTRANSKRRAAALLPALFLARVDGKSPVEYLTRESEREAVRRCAAPLVARPPMRLRDVAEAWGRAA